MNSELEVELERKIGVLKKTVGTGTSENTTEFLAKFEELKIWLNELNDVEKIKIYSLAIIEIENIKNLLADKMKLIENIREDQSAVHKANNSYGIY